MTAVRSDVQRTLVHEACVETGLQYEQVKVNSVNEMIKKKQLFLSTHEN